MPDFLPDDRVLVGVIKRVTDLEAARLRGWYRIPRDSAPRVIEVEVLAFYLRQGFQKRSGGIHFYARLRGHELVRRRDLLPAEAEHRRADDLYFKMQIGPLQERVPPILNPTRRAVAFIHTTWDRFVAAKALTDLYGTSDLFVERARRGLEKLGIPAEQRWEAERADKRSAELRIRCEQGLLAVIASEGETDTPASEVLRMEPEPSGPTPAQMKAIQAAVEALGGPRFPRIPIEG